MNYKFGFVPGGPTLTLTAAALATMVSHRQLKPKDKESGGQLFAEFKPGDTVVVKATGPSPLDKRLRCLFVPSLLRQRREIEALYKQGKHFVGDWHTHPEPIPTPSADDIKSMLDCFNKSRHELKAFLMVIIGTLDPPEGLSVFLVDGSGIRKMILC